jgi:dolichyl-diphosphooligosaccharide--protein glycosyltransferase
VLLATMPGPFLDRTVLGYVDHHAGEVFFSSLVMLGLGVTLRQAPGERFGERLAAGGWACATGLALGAYLLTWTSGSFLVFILALWAFAQYSIDHLRGTPSDRVARALGPALAVAAAMVLLFEDSRTPGRDLQLAAVLGTLGIVAGLEGLRRIWQRLAWPAPLFVAALAAAGIALALGGLAGAPRLADAVLINMRRLLPTAAAQTVGEARPLLTLYGVVSLLPAWFVFRSGFFLAAPAIVLLAADVWRRRYPERTLLLVWTIVVLLATLGQNRFGYYLAIELALLGGWLSARALRWAGAAGAARTARAGAKTPLRADLAVIVVSAIVFYPNVRPALAGARRDYGMPSAWQRAFTWMRTSTPDPFGDPNHYWSRASDGGPRAAYAVMNWWDYGYWLMRVAHRVPVSNPTQAGASEAARFYTETDPAAAVAMLRTAHARYILTGEELPMRASAGGGVWQQWFPSIVEWAGHPQSRYYETFLRRDGNGTLTPVVVFHPAYYESMAIRLYLFGGGEATPHHSTSVIGWERRSIGGGRSYREIVDARVFATYADAEAHVARAGPGNRAIVGIDPLRTCVPLAALRDVRLVYQSDERSTAFPETPAVRVFEIN